MRSMIIKFCWGTMLSGAVAGCAGAADEPIDCADGSCDLGAESSSEEVGSTSQALATQWATGPFTWKQSDPSHTRMVTKAENICVLTKIGGRFQGGGENVQVYDDGEFWYLGGASQQSGVNGEAYCFPRSGFIGHNTNRQVSSQYVLPITSNCTVQRGDLYARDAFPFLQGMKGNLAGGGEYARILQTISADVLNRWEARTCVGSTLTVFARNFRVGPISTTLARFIGPNGRGDALSNPEYVVSGDLGYKVMANVSDAMCAFTHLGGNFSGGGESARIGIANIPTPNGTVKRWTLTTLTQTDSQSLKAGARCFARDQTL